MPTGKNKKKDHIEIALFEEFKSFGLPLPVKQHVFHPQRDWRFDFAWVEKKIAVEVQGGIYIPFTGHNNGAAMERDYEKFNAATRFGWALFLFGPSQCRSLSRTATPSAAVAFMYQVLRGAGLIRNGAFEKQWMFESDKPATLELEL